MLSPFGPLCPSHFRHMLIIPFLKPFVLSLLWRDNKLLQMSFIQCTFELVFFHHAWFFMVCMFYENNII
jgi:hypothetical protein